MVCTLAALLIACAASAQEGAAPAAPPAAAPLEVPDDPLVRALLETRPTEPAEIIQSVLALDDLGHASLGRQLLARLLEAQPSQETLAELADQFGSATLLRLARIEGLQPEGRRLSDAALSAAHARDRDPKNFEIWIGQLSQGTPREKAAARLALRRAGAPGAAAMVAVLADPARQAEHPALRSALVASDRRAIGPLLAAVDSGDPALRAVALRILGELSEFDAPEWLYHWAWSEDDPASAKIASEILATRFGRTATPAQAAIALRRIAEDHLSGRREHAANGDDDAALWAWDAENRRPVAKAVAAIDIARGVALRHLRAAQRLSPDDATIGRLRAALLLAEADRSPELADEIAALPPLEVENVLDAALASGDHRAAAAAARRLAEIGTAETLLLDHSPALSPLAKALQSSDAEVRWAALQAVVQLDPGRPFPGASYVGDALRSFALAKGKPRVVIAHRSSAEAQRLAGYFAQLGYETDVVLESTPLLRHASSSPDVALVVIDADYLRPSAAAACEMIRSNPTTAELPVAFIAIADNHDRASRMAARYKRSFVVLSPLDLEPLRTQLAAFDEALAEPAGDGAALDRARAAIVWAGDLLVRQTPTASGQLVDTLLAALVEPALSADAAQALAKLPSRSTQRALASAAARKSLPLEARMAAAKAFAESVATGVHLTPDEVLAQYEVYNLAPLDDDATRQVMAIVLDAMELSAADEAEEEAAQTGATPDG